MSTFRLTLLFACLTAVLPRARAEEVNFWPVHVARDDAHGQVVEWQTVGPLIFSQPAADETTAAGFRPLFVQQKNNQGVVISASFLYPIYVYRADAETYRWSILNLINGSGPKEGFEKAAGDETKTFDLWPFYFSRDTGVPDTSYRALFPVAGTVKYRFQHERLSWFLWPLYLDTENRGVKTTYTPWPFIQVVHGTDSGFALWPLYGRHDSSDHTQRNFFLWPLGWNNTIQPDEFAPAGTPPTRQVGFLPFFTHEKRPDYVNEDFLWPFFGYTDRTAPKKYHETRYFWPFLVQAHGDDKMINRWAPVYTHSNMKGLDSTWYLWPLVKKTEWQERNVAQKKTQFLYLLYSDLEQRSLTNPSAAPGHRTHVWPLLSRWDNGAGHQQLQLFSPFDVFWPYNEQVRANWTPLFAIYRSDRQGPDQYRWSLLWNAVTWRHQAGDKEFHLGPIFGVHEQPEKKRVALLGGLLGWQRGAAGTGWSLFWFDFSSKATKVAEVSR